MCLPKTPDVPVVQERQANKLPDDGGTAGRQDNAISRRRALMATVLTGGTLGAPNVTKLGA